MKNTNTIEWHKECMKNWQDHLSREEKILESRILSFKADKESLAFYQHQIGEAVRKGKGCFDRERFLVRRGPK